jgi:hypothetical protein
MMRYHKRNRAGGFRWFDQNVSWGCSKLEDRKGIYFGWEGTIQRLLPVHDHIDGGNLRGSFIFSH